MFRSVFKTGIRGSYSISDNALFASESWTIYPAKHKTTGKHASVFIFDKTKFEAAVNRMCSGTSSSVNPKTIINECYQLVRFEIGQLAKLKHPQVLTMFEALEESKSKFIFASEPVTGNLMTLNLDKELDFLSIQKGLLQIAKGLQFLHNHCQIVHFNLQPTSVFVTAAGDWKLAGFKFLKNLSEISSEERSSFFLMNNSSAVAFTNLNLNFSAPEIVIDKDAKIDYANDIWSLGCLIYYLYNKGDSIINCFDINSITDYRSEFSKFEKKFYNKRAIDLKYFLKDIPDSLYSLLPQIFSRFPSDRIVIDKFINSSFFEGSMLKAMLFVDEFPTKNSDDKCVFLQGIISVDSKTKASLLSVFPTNFKTQKLLPLLTTSLLDEVKLTKSTTEQCSAKLVAICLTCILKIGADLSGLSFQDKIYQTLLKGEISTKKSSGTLPKILNVSVKVRLALANELEVLANKLNDKQFVGIIKSLLDIFLKSAPSDNGTVDDQILLQETFLKKINLFAKKLDFPYVKRTFFPTLCEVFQTTTILSTKVATIDAFDALVSNKIVDQVIVKEQLLPVISKLKSRNNMIVKRTLSFLLLLNTDESISLALEDKVEIIITQALKLAFGAESCTQAEFRNYMEIVTKIQRSAIEEKLNDLSQSSNNAHGSSDNFQTLIKKQVVSESDIERITKGPQHSAMMPSKKNTKSALPKSPSNNNKLDPSILVPTKNSYPQRNTTVAPIVLGKRHSTENRVGLRFGSVSPTPNSNTSEVLSTIKSTFEHMKEDEFSDFQEASAPASQISNDSKIKHNSNLSPNLSSAQNAASLPPGYNSNMVLSPKSAIRDIHKSHLSVGNDGNENSLLDIL